MQATGRGGDDRAGPVRYPFIIPTPTGAIRAASDVWSVDCNDAPRETNPPVSWVIPVHHMFPGCMTWRKLVVRCAVSVKEFSIIKGV